MVSDIVSSIAEALFVASFIASFELIPSSNAAITIALNSTGKWPNGYIPYRFDQKITDYARLDKIMIAMQQIETFTGGCIRFRQRVSEKDFIIIQDESYTQNQTCFSYVGRTGNWQPVRFSRSCLNTTGDVIHMLTRVIGMYPESNRPDRDQYISIQWDNILAEKAIEYSIIPYSYQMHVFPGEYDYGSITHFVQWQFSRGSNRATWVLPPGVPHPGIEVNGTIGQRSGLSIGDVAAIRFLYNCSYSATFVPDINCRSGGQTHRGRPAGWFFCRCGVNNFTGEPYFTGERCADARCSPECSKKPNSVCTVDDSGAMSLTRCDCVSGWLAPSCDQSYCQIPCFNGGVCTGPNQCRCPPEFIGGQCQSNVTCNPICQNFGECTGSSAGAICRCQPGWFGATCTRPICSLPCLNGGSCVAPETCNCPTGYHGIRCENSNITFGLPCDSDYECQRGWGDMNSYCNLNSSCPGVNRTCLCKPGFERLPSGGPCRQQKLLGEVCSYLYDVCQRDSECIEGICQCNELKGWVRGPLSDCVKIGKVRVGQCNEWDDCLYNRTCGDNGQCQCPPGTVDDTAFGSYTCRPRRWGESCNTDEDCRYVGVDTICRDQRIADGALSQRACDCRIGLPFEFLVDRYTVGYTCLPPFPQRYGERCSVDFWRQPQYGPCDRGLVCELCPRTVDEYRCQNYMQPLIGKAASNNKANIVLALGLMNILNFK